MIHVWGVSGEELALVPVAEIGDVRTLKRRLQKAHGFPRFRQRLLCDGSILDDAALLDSPVHLHLVVLPYPEPHIAQESADELVAAVAFTWVSEVERILGGPQDPNLADARGSRPLVIAGSNGRVELVRLLLEAMADANLADGDGDRALICAANEGCEDIVRLLLESKADKDATDSFGRTALRCASMEGRLDVVRCLLEAGSDKDLADKNGD